MTAQNHRDPGNLLKLIGWLAVGGVSIGVVADLFSGWSINPNSMTTAVSLGLDNIKGLFVDKPRWTYILGNYLAVFFLPFHIVGSFLVYLTIRPVSRIHALFYFVPAAYLAVLGTGYHGTYAFVGDIVQSGNKVLMQNMLDYWLYWGAILVVGYSVMSVYLVVLVLSNHTIFPKWVALVSPLAIVVFTAILTFLLPDNLVGLKVALTVTGLNLPLAIFYFIAVKFLLRQKRVDLTFP